MTAAVFPIDPSLGYPFHAPVVNAPTTVGRIHQAAGPIFVLTLAVAAFFTRSFLRGVGVAASWAARSWVTGLVIVLAFATCSVLVTLDYAGAVPSAWSGLFERIAIYASLLWTSWTALGTSRSPLSSRTSRPPRERTSPPKRLDETDVR